MSTGNEVEWVTVVDKLKKMSFWYLSTWMMRLVTWCDLGIWNPIFQKNQWRRQKIVSYTRYIANCDAPLPHYPHNKLLLHLVSQFETKVGNFFWLSVHFMLFVFDMRGWKLKEKKFRVSRNWFFDTDSIFDGVLYRFLIWNLKPVLPFLDTTDIPKPLHHWLRFIDFHVFSWTTEFKI